MKSHFTGLVFGVLLIIAASVHMDRAIIWGEEAVTENQAVEIANKEILKREKDINSLTVDLDKRWHPDQNQKTYQVILDYFPQVAAKLQGSNYWAVHYSPKSPYRRGGAYTVFVEKNTGEVLGVIAWE